jgi:hypothetical protein
MGWPSVTGLAIGCCGNTNSKEAALLQQLSQLPLQYDAASNELQVNKRLSMLLLHQWYVKILLLPH